MPKLKPIRLVRIRCFLLLLLVVGLCLSIMLAISHWNGGSLYKKYSRGLDEVSPFSLCPETESSTMSVNKRRRLAKTLSDIQREIQCLAGREAIIKAKWSVELAAIASELDPRLLSSHTNSWEYSARLANTGPAPRLPNMTRHVCPEVYFGPNYDYPFFQHGMEPENCNYVPEFSSVLTIVLPAIGWESNLVDFIIKQIRKFYNIPIIAITSKTGKIDKITHNVSVIVSEKEAKSLNKAVAMVKTPFVMIGLSMSHFSNQSSLERLVRILNELEHIKVAGGAARDVQGCWIHGCLQQRMANYQARYAMGYYYSKYECMYCDDILTPFVTYRNVLIDLQFSNDLYGPALYRDWFARVISKGHLIVSCPDVMFFMHSHVTMNELSWHLFAKKWKLERIHSFDDQIFNFSCESVNIQCKKPNFIIKTKLLPRCCMAIMEKYLYILDEFAKTNSLRYELQAGANLGAVKMGGYLPWDTDIDIFFERKDYKKWLHGKSQLKDICRFDIQKPSKYVIINCPFSFLEIVCHKSNLLSQIYLPSEYHNTPTTIKYSGFDVVVNANPGLYSRNRLGLRDLKHAVHQRNKHATELTIAKGGYDNPGSWKPCNSDFHSCLDQFPGDGNLPFLEPFLNL